MRQFLVGIFQLVLLVTSVTLAPGAADAAQYILHPSGTAGGNGFSFSGSSSSDLDTNDGDSSYGWSSSSSNDLFMNIDDPVAPPGTINWVSVTAVAKDTSAGTASTTFRVGVQLGASTTYTGNYSSPDNYATYTSPQWTTKPGGGAWTWTDINNLAATVDKNQANSVTLRVTELYVTVDYTMTANITSESASPNPFNPNSQSTTISYTLANYGASPADLLWMKIYDYNGAIVRNLVTPGSYSTANKNPGANSDVWNGRNDASAIVANGTYSYHIDAAAWMKTASTSGSGKPYDIAGPSSVYDTLYIVTDTSPYLYRTQNGGTNWTGISGFNNGNINGTAYGIAVSSDGRRIYAAARNDGIRYSTNGGSNWTTTQPGGNKEMVDVAMDSSGTIIYALMNKSGGSKRVYKSTNGGGSWTNVTGVTMSDPWGIACSADGQIVYVIDPTTSPGTNNAKLYKSINGGSSWTTTTITRGTAVGNVSYPFQIAMDADGGYYIAERGNHRVQKFDASGASVIIIGGTASGSGTYQFSAGTTAYFGVGAVNYDENHMLWVADVNNTRAMKYIISDFASTTDIRVCGTGCTDATQPSSTTDLRAGTLLQTSVEIIWTAPTRNGTGLYDIRYATQPINQENWASADQVVGEPEPASAGTTEVFSVSNLNPGTTYYFALKTKGDNGFWSDLSNVVAASTEGMSAKAVVVYSSIASPGSRYPKYKMWLNNGWSNEYTLPPVTSGASVRQVTVRTAPAGSNERVAGVYDSTNRLFLYSWKGTDWTSWEAAGIQLAANNYNKYDIAYEQMSGEAIVVYSLSASSTTLNYRVWDGAEWGAEAAIPAIPTTGTIYWVRLEPKPGSDEIMLVWSDSLFKMGAAVWDGTAWTVRAGTFNANNLGTATLQAWDVAYETTTGRAMIVWLDTTTTPKYRTYLSGTWSNETSTGLTISGNDYLRLQADPRSGQNRIIMGVGSDSLNTLVTTLWTGSAWNSVLTLTSQYSPATAGSRAFDFAWESRTGRSVVVYGNGNSSSTRGQYRVWDGVTWAIGNWTSQANLPTGAERPEWIQLRADPGSDGIMAGITDSSRDFNIHRWNGSAWLDRQEFTLDVSSVSGENFMFSYRTDAIPTVNIIDPGFDYILSGTTYTIRGTARDDNGVSRVDVSIARDSAPVTYWTGAQWSTTQSWLRADNTLSWFHVWQLPIDNGVYTYTITARAIDNEQQTGEAATPITGIKVYTIADPLTVYRNSATVDSSTQITARAWFTGDGNGDSSTQFETGPAAGGPWTDRGSLSTETWDQQHFLREKAISGLTAGTVYYVRITHTDADGVSGTNPAVLGPYTTKTNGTTTRDITAVVDDCNTTTVNASFDNDGDNDGATAFFYSTDGSSWTAAPGCGAVSGASPRTCTVTGLTANTNYYYRATFSDADGVSGLNPINTPITNPSPYKTPVSCLVKGTTVGTLSVDNTSCRQFSVRAAFTGDQDDDGSILVEFKKAADSTWATACDGIKGGTPRTCYVTGIEGLTASTSYNVRVTWSDPDGVSGTNPQNTTLSTPACGAADIFPPTLTLFRPMDGATVSGDATYPVRVEVTAYDRGGLNTSSVKVIVNGTEYAATANPNVSGNYYYDWTPASINHHSIQAKATDNAGNVGYSSTFRVYVNSVTTDSHGLFTGDGKLLVRENTSQLCFDCHGGIQSHSSQATSSKYGNWGIDCRTCHTPHNTRNIFLIRPVIKTPNSGDKAIDFRNTTGQADYSYATRTTPGNGVCEVCHTKTRNGDDSGRYRNTGTGPGPKGDSHFTDQACTDCHKHTQGFSPISAGNLTCGTCHPDRWTAMNGKTDEYHMYMQNSDTTAITGGIGTGNKYPNKSQFGSGDKESEHRRCIMCHADMDVFHYKNNPDTPGVSYNLRVSIDVAPDPADPSTQSNTDFRSERADGGICLSCHRYSQTKNTAKMKNSGTTVTPAWDIDLFKIGTHKYSVPTTFKADNSTFNAVCVKCHTDTMVKDYQSSTYRVGAHSGTTRSYLSNVNKNATLVETTFNSLEENMCFQCHSMSTDGPDNYNPNGWDGVSAGDGKDAYNFQPMAKKVQRIKELFTKRSFHPITGAPPYADLNGLAAAAGRHKADEWIAVADGVQVANWNPSHARHVECMDCHNPHATNSTPRDLSAWRPNPYHTTTTNYGSGANGRMSGFQVVEGSFGGSIGGENYGVWGVEPTYGAAGSPPTSFTKKAAVDNVYQLCFKCHSIYAYGSTKPKIPWGTPSRTPGAGDGWGGNPTADFNWDVGDESDISQDFNPNNYGFHPVVRRGRNQPAPNLNLDWPYFNGAGTMWKTSGTTTSRVDYNAATKRVTRKAGDAWVFPTYLVQPGWKFQFKGSPAAATSGDTLSWWYEIKQVISNTEVELVSGPAANQTNQPFNTTAGLGWSFVPPWGPWSTLACSDCHQSGALEDPMGPHGSDNPWILRELKYDARVDNNLDGDITDNVDYINTTSANPGNPTNARAEWEASYTYATICYSCHRRDVYGMDSDGVTAIGDPPFPSGTVNYSTKYGRALDGHPPGKASRESDPKWNAWGIFCMNCHGAPASGGVGGIHGSNQGNGSGGSSPLGLRLRNGAGVTGQTLSSSGGSCWSKGSTDSVNSCTQGHGGQGYSSNYNYTGAD